jgi:hypothetical protein
MDAFSWDESHIEWFSNFIKDKPDVTASSFGRKNIPGIGRRLVYKQDRRNLMEILVKKGLAIVVIGQVTDNNYRIASISKNVRKLHFKHEMLFDERINNLPDIAWLAQTDPSKHLSLASLLRWLEYKLIWLEIVNLLRVYQVKGQISKENLQQVWKPTMQKYLLIKAKEKIQMYSLVCLSWEQFDLTLEGLFHTPEDCFLDMLFVDAELEFFGENTQRNKPVKQRYNELAKIVMFERYGSLHGNYIEEKADKKIAQLFKELAPEIKLTTGEVWYQNSTSYRIFASAAWIMDLVKECNITEIEQAAKDYLEIKTLLMDHRLSIFASKSRSSIS